MSRTAVSTICVLFILLAPNLAHADSHRMETTPTGWWWLHSQSAADIADFLEETDARLMDIEIQGTEPLRFVSAFVQNSGVYAETWWWYFDQTPGDIEILLERNDARLIDIERYGTENGPRYAVIMVDNSGADATGWWWYLGATGQFLDGVIDDDHARLVDIESYQDDGTKFAAILVDNSGANAMEWWWYRNVPGSVIQNNIDTNESRLLEYEIRNPLTPTFDAILIPNQAPNEIRWWWYFDQTQAELNAQLSQNGARIADLDVTVEIGGARRYSVVMVNNSNGLTTKMGGLLGYGTDGATGAYLKEVGGPVLAALQPDFVYEPSSSLKVTHHLYAMRQVMIGADLLTNEFTVAKGTIGSCPNDGPPFNDQTLEETLSGMMWYSDNTDTRGVELRYGRIAINSMSQLLVGMENTSINRRMGCAELPLNETTLHDMGLLYEGVAQGLYLDDDTREDFYRLMQGKSTPTVGWFTVDLWYLIHDVAADLGIPAAATQFWNNMHLAWKPGGDTFNFDGITEHRSIFGWVSLPWNCGGPEIQNKDFVFGLFVHGALDGGYADDRLFDYSIELLRDPVAAGLISCVSAVGDPVSLAATPVLRPAFPNPFNPQTTIAFELPKQETVTLRVFDMSGRSVKNLITAEPHTPGRHEVVWNGRDESGRQVASGTYFYRLEAGSYSETKRMVLIK